MHHTLQPVEVFAEVACPFTHVGLRRFVAARAASGTARPLVVRAWPLELINGHPLEPSRVAAEIEALRATVAPELFAAFDTATFPQSSIPAFGLAAAGYAVGAATGEAVSLAVRDAIFEQGLDVTDVDVLESIGAAHGVAPLDACRAAAAVQADWQLGRQRGVRGSPHFFDGDDSWFCPALDITSIDGRFAVTIATGADAFYDTALRRGRARATVTTGARHADP
jgi:predicted DsbA family dithiol-disulfide isomerase